MHNPHKSQGLFSLDEHDRRRQRQSQLSQQDQISNNRAHQSALGSVIDVSNRVDQSADDGHHSNHCHGDGEVDAAHEVHDQTWGGEFEEVVMGALGVVEPVPLFVGEFGRVAAVAHVGVPSFLDLASCGSLMLISKVGLHEVFGEDLASDLAGEEEADEEYLEGNKHSNQEDVAVVIGEREGASEGCGVDDLHMHIYLWRYA